MPDTDRPVASPCVNVCELDETDICLGCGRSLQEIGDWVCVSEAEKAQIVERAAGRRHMRLKQAN